MRLTTLQALLLAVILAVSLAGGTVRAQADTRGLVDRIDRLERELNILQGQAYRGGSAPTVITSPALGGGTTTQSGGAVVGAPLSGDAYSSLDRRISALETQIRDVTGRLEETNHQISLLSAKIDRMQADTDVRLKEAEQKAGAGPAAAQGGNAGALAAQPPTDDQQPEFNPTRGSPPGNLVHPGNKSAAASPAASAASIPGNTPQEKYDYAFGLLRGSDYDGATKAFRAFIGSYPRDPLAGNATYWLGQIPYAQGHYEEAAPLFLDAYRKYPKSAKAAESLLKVGMSMSHLGKKKEACAAIERFRKEFPDAADNLKRQAAAEKKKNGC